MLNITSSENLERFSDDLGYVLNSTDNYLINTRLSANPVNLEKFSFCFNSLQENLYNRSHLKSSCRVEIQTPSSATKPKPSHPKRKA